MASIADSDFQDDPHHSGPDQTAYLYIFDSGGMPTIPRPSGADSSGHYEPADMTVLLQDELDTDDRLQKRRRDTETSLMRDMFTKSIELNGMLRPLQA
jgi:hypothetical protein